MEFLEYLDIRFLLFINQNHTPQMDMLMWWISDKYIWIPFYAMIALFTVKELGKKAIPLLLLIVILILISDQIASGILKNAVHRLRPSHDPDVEYMLHYVNNYRGGLYGFVSSHSMNAFSLSFYFLFATESKVKWIPLILFPWAFMIAYSRVYLGVHYPSDVIVPILMSLPIAYGISKIYKFIAEEYFDTTKLNKIPKI